MVLYGFVTKSDPQMVQPRPVICYFTLPQNHTIIMIIIMTSVIKHHKSTNVTSTSGVFYGIDMCRFSSQTCWMLQYPQFPSISQIFKLLLRCISYVQFMLA